MKEKKEHPTVRLGKLYSKLSGQDHLIQVEHFTPQKTTKKNHGSIYFVIDLKHPNSESQAVIDTIIKTTIKHFYKNLDDTLTSFEIALRHVNEELATLAESGNSEWINNLNSLIAIVSGKDIHITQCGTAEGFLIRNKIISHITEGLSDKNDDKHPLNTFINISSGRMNEGDRIVMSTEHLFNNLSLDRLRRLAVQHSPTTCVAEIARILAQENVRSIGTIILESTTEEKLAKEVIRPQPEEVILQDRQHQGTKFSSFVSNSQGFFSKISSTFSVFYQKTSDFVTKIIKRKPSLKKSTNTKPNSKRQRAPINPPEKIVSKTVRQHAATTSIKTSISADLLQKINQKAPNKTIIVIGIIVLMVATLGISITYLINKQDLNNKQKLVQDKITTAEGLVNEANNALIVKDKPTAQAKYTEAQDILSEIESSPYFSEEISALKTKIASKKDEADNITRILTSASLANFSSLSQTTPQTFTHLNKIAENLYSFSTNIASANITSGKLTNITGFDINNFVGSTAVDDNKAIVFYHNGQMQKFDPESNTLQDLSSLDSAWKPGVEIASYYNNIYVLSPMENQIYKYSSLGGVDYSSASAYIDQAGALDLSNAESITIDGSIYILKKNGEIFKFTQGEFESYNIKGIPEPYSKLANPTQIYTTENLDYIFILDPGNKRILQIKKETGEYIKQFVGEDLDKMDSFEINDKIKTIYLLADNKIFVVNY